MKKKIIGILIAICVTVTPIAILGKDMDYSYLEELSVKELNELQEAISNTLNGNISLQEKYAYLEDLSIKELREMGETIENLFENQENTESKDSIDSHETEPEIGQIEIAYVTNNLGTTELKKKVIDENLDVLKESFVDIDLSDSEWVDFAYVYLLGCNMTWEEFAVFEGNEPWKVEMNLDDSIYYYLDNCSFLGEVGQYKLIFQKTRDMWDKMRFKSKTMKKENLKEYFEEHLFNEEDERTPSGDLSKYYYYYEWFPSNEYIINGSLIKNGTSFDVFINYGMGRHNKRIYNLKG